jgi:hypothetical protein
MALLFIADSQGIVEPGALQEYRVERAAKCQFPKPEQWPGAAVA